MENNRRCAIFSPSSFFGAEKNGSRSCCCFSKYSRFDYRIFSIFRVFVWASVWFCACFCRPALAQSPDYSGQLRTIIDLQTDHSEYFYDIKEINDDILGEASAIDDLLQDNLSLLEDIFRSIGYRYDGSDSLSKDLDTVINFLTKYESILGYGVGSSQSGSVKESLYTIDYDINALKNTLGFSESESLRAKLDAILLALENLQDSSGSGSEEITQDWVKEETFNAFSSKYEGFSNRYFSVFGFTNEQTLKNNLDNFKGYFSPDNSIGFYHFKPRPKSTVPYPDSSYQWWEFDDIGPTWSSFSSNGSFWSDYAYINSVFQEDNINFWLGNLKKQAWNDWQSHTNTLSRLDMIVESLNTVPEERISGTDDIGTVSEDQLNITFDKSTGDSPESIDLQPAFTNDLAELTAPANDLTNKLANLITYSKLSNRYKAPIVDNTNYRDYEITQDIPDYTLQYGTRPGMSFKFTSTARDLFRGFLSRETMSSLRSIFLKLWTFLAVYCNFLIFKIFGKMGGNE